ncbi:MAG: hypothetical protein ABIO55_16650 [Ginsengibacter sp.]
MPVNTLKEKLIDKIKQTDDSALLEEASALFELQEPETIYTINEEQAIAIKEAKEQIKKGQTLSNNDANSEADKWVNE